MKSVCVFCGSRSGSKNIYGTLAEELGSKLVENNIQLIYGGGKVGLMGEIADAVLRKNGKATGVIPEFLFHKEVAHKGLTELLIVGSMHERKLKMSELSDGFIAMPGGFRTLEELAEIITWNQLQLINKPVGILNVSGYFDHLLKFFDNGVDDGFIDKYFRDNIIDDTDPSNLLDKMKSGYTDKPQKENLSKS